MRLSGRLDYLEMPATGETLDRLKAFYSTAFAWSFTDYGPTYSAFAEGLDGGFQADVAEAPGLERKADPEIDRANDQKEEYGRQTAPDQGRRGRLARVASADDADHEDDHQHDHHRPQPPAAEEVLEAVQTSAKAEYSGEHVRLPSVCVRQLCRRSIYVR